MINYLEFVSQHENATQLMSSEGRVTDCIRELEGLEKKPDIDHGEVEFVPAAETDSLVGELINMANESNVADPQNRGRTTTLKNAVTVISTDSKTLGNNIEIDALTDSVPKLLHSNFLICRVCFEQFSNPKILPCHHTFCEKCLHSLRKKDSNRLDCPSCKESCQLTDDGVSGLPNNTYLQSLSAKVPQSAKEYVVLNGKCSICNKVKATHVCIWRQIDLCCSECSKIVKNITKKTLATDECVLTIEEYKKFRSDDQTKVQTMSYCKSHKGYLINLYCNTCKSPICSACTESVHPKEKHTINFLKNVSDDYRKGLVESIRNLNKQATVARERKNEGKLLQNNFEMKCGDRVRSISRKAKTMHEKVKLEETTILEDLEKKYIVKVKKTQSDIDELQIKYGKLVSMVSYIEMMRHHKNAAELMAAKRNLNKKIDELLEMDNTSVVEKIIVEFQPCDDGRRGDLVGVLRSDVCITQCTVDGVPQRLIKGQNVDLLITTRDHRGKAVNPNQKVKVTLTLPDGSYKDVKVTEKGDGTHTVTVHGEVVGDYKVSISVSGQAIPGSPFDFRVLIPLVKTLGKNGKEDGCFDNPKGLAFTKDGNLAVADVANNRIQVIDLDGKMVRTFTFTQFEKKFKPWNVAISKEGLHFMTDRENKQVVVSDVNGKFMRSFGQTELRHPMGIAIHPLNGIVYVTDWDGKASKDTDRDGHYVRKYTQEGKYINSFGGYGEKKGQFCAPYSVDFDSKGKVYVSDFNNSRVQVFDERDRFVRSFGCYGDADGQFEHPSGIVVSKDNFVYVADEYANKIQKFDTNGRFMYRIDSDEDNLNRPIGIVQAVDDPKKLIVSDSWNHCIKVFVD
ncbi:tripartite motif-containing protein 2-like [Ptychodera flava]|uniref:tripartite motif-containing protein 2-like n=1 Tax=Ptychodera flava TaxID=63121 RepID=UPI003969F992